MYVQYIGYEYLIILYVSCHIIRLHLEFREEELFIFSNIDATKWIT